MRFDLLSLCPNFTLMHIDRHSNARQRSSRQQRLRRDLGPVWFVISVLDLCQNSPTYRAFIGQPFACTSVSKAVAARDRRMALSSNRGRVGGKGMRVIPLSSRRSGQAPPTRGLTHYMKSGSGPLSLSGDVLASAALSIAANFVSSPSPTFKSSSSSSLHF